MRYVSLVEQNIKFYLNKKRVQSVYKKIDNKLLRCYVFLYKKNLFNFITSKYVRFLKLQVT